MTAGTATAGARAAGASGAAERVRLAERIGAAVADLPEVAGLSAGPRAHVVTYRVGAPYAGVAVREGEIEVGVTVARPDRPLPAIAESVRRAALPLAGGRPVHVLVADIAEED
ncbi:hypothetical protein [Spirillospora sp. NPDC029432]|uniref:hypothetical protein n=1 Tax=Spirillospora sp. NPDC029432 TaxID=3154599 RepID=UPI003453512B